MRILVTGAAGHASIGEIGERLIVVHSLAQNGLRAIEEPPGACGKCPAPLVDRTKGIIFRPWTVSAHMASRARMDALQYRL